MAFSIKSPAFNNGEMMPAQYTCDGKDISPPLKWQDAPDNTRSFVLIVDDPDAPAGTWDHWILFNIPASVNELSENIQTLPAGTQKGMNSWKRTGYNGPCPPDRLHHYYFRLYAVDSVLPLKEGATRSAIEQAMHNHMITYVKLMAKYERKK